MTHILLLAWMLGTISVSIGMEWLDRAGLLDQIAELLELEHGRPAPDKRVLKALMLVMWPVILPFLFRKR